jgi:hypothetical protein
MYKVMNFFRGTFSPSLFRRTKNASTKIFAEDFSTKYAKTFALKIAKVTKKIV